MCNKTLKDTFFNFPFACFVTISGLNERCFDARFGVINAVLPCKIALIGVYQCFINHKSGMLYTAEQYALHYKTVLVTMKNSIRYRPTDTVL